jgi:hypothetical protein
MFFFAWCGPSESFGTDHLREDEIVFAFDIAHQEGQIPTLSIDIKNPHIGLLAPGRAQWAWLSWQQSDEDDPVPLFYGRLVALPSNLLGEVVTLEFIARPIDFLAQKQDIADSLMVEPFYDPIWIDQAKLDDPDTVLETYAMAWHVDRIDHVVSVSDIISGEDGTKEFQAEDSFYDSVEIAFAQSPQTQVVFDGTVQWTQTNTGFITMPAVSFIAWNGDQIVNDWPKPGDKLDGGWSVYDASILNWADGSAAAANSPFVITVGGGTAPNVTPSTPPNNQSGSIGNPGELGAPGVTSQMPAQSPTGGGPVSWSISYSSNSKQHQDGDVIGVSESLNYDAQGGWGGVVKSRSISISHTDTGVSSYSQSISWERMVGSPQQAPATTPKTPITVDGEGNTSGGDTVTIPSLYGQMILQYDLNFPRIETIKFVMNSQVQPIVLLPPDEPANQIKLSMHGADLGLPIDPGAGLPIGDPMRSAFFPTDRGMLAVQYPLLVARAHLMQSARAAKINFDCSFERAIELSCRMNALLHDPRLPGGQVTGKITEYHIKADGDKGQLSGQVQIESTIGTGVPITLREGSPTYVEEGYVEVGYQFYSDADIGLPTGDGNIEMPPSYFDPTQMVLPLTFNDAVVAFQVHEGTPIDVVLAGGAGATADPTWLEIVLNPVTGQRYQNDYDLGASILALPKLIDLAAPSA